jgi:hypothetical protein
VHTSLKIKQHARLARLAAYVFAAVFLGAAHPSFAQTTKEKFVMSTTTHLAQAPASAADFQVFEFRRYKIKPGVRQDFATYFESYFPEAFQQLGALAFGEGFERDHTDGFTWLRGFRSMDARAMANSTFYYGPVWREHRTTLNNLIDDSDNVYLMRPLHPENGLSLLPAVDPVREREGAQGVLVAQLFAVKNGNMDTFARQAEERFAQYRAAGLREAGVLVTLDAPNNFPQLPIRTDGPYLLWLGIAKDVASVDQVWKPLADQVQRHLAETGLLAQATEQIVVTPAPRSRLRWQAQ